MRHFIGILYISHTPWLSSEQKNFSYLLKSDSFLKISFFADIFKSISTAT